MAASRTSPSLLKARSGGSRAAPRVVLRAMRHILCRGRSNRVRNLLVPLLQVTRSVRGRPQPHQEGTCPALAMGQPMAAWPVAAGKVWARSRHPHGHKQHRLLCQADGGHVGTATGTVWRNAMDPAPASRNLHRLWIRANDCNVQPHPAPMMPPACARSCRGNLVSRYQAAGMYMAVSGGTMAMLIREQMTSMPVTGVRARLAHGAGNVHRLVRRQGPQARQRSWATRSSSCKGADRVRRQVLTLGWPTAAGGTSESQAAPMWLQA